MHDILRLMWHCGFVAKTVLVILFLLSLVSWAIIFQKVALFARMHRATKSFSNLYKKRTGWNDLYLSSFNLSVSPHARLLVKGIQEISSWKKEETTPNPSHRRAALLQTLRTAASEEMSRLDRHLTFLSTCVSVSPFLGLFGTVWGVMSAFLSIGTQGNADIATVGPGIAEALITTVVGLFVAIPALTAYNLFISRLRKMEASLNQFIEEFLLSVSKGAGS